MAGSAFASIGGRKPTSSGSGSGNILDSLSKTLGSAGSGSGSDMVMTQYGPRPRSEVQNAGGGGGGGGGSSSGSSSSSSSAINPASPGPVNISADVDPMEKSAFDSWDKYNRELAAGTNEEITREIGRARDEISVGMEKEGEAAIGRGANAGFFRSRALESGKRDLSNLQGRLADVALQRREGALTGLTGSASNAATGRRTLALGTAAARLADQRYVLDAAEAKRQADLAPHQMLLNTLETVGRLYGSGVL